MTTGIKNGVRTRLWRDGRLEVEDFPIEEASDHLQEEGALVWLDLCDPYHDLLLKLADELTLDPHAVEDAISNSERPKATRHATHTFVTVYGTRLDVGGSSQLGPLDSRVEISRVSAFVMPRGIVTVRNRDFDIDQVVDRWEEDPELLKLGPGALLHGLLDVVVDGHFETVQLMDDAIEALEDGLFDDRAVTREIQQRTYRVRKELVEMRRVILPMREVVNAVQRHCSEGNGHRDELDGWYSDLYDHVLRASKWTESLRDMVTTVFETNLSLQDARLNTVMKKLAGWAAIIAVPTAVTGWPEHPLPRLRQAFGAVRQRHGDHRHGGHALPCLQTPRLALTKPAPTPPSTHSHRVAQPRGWTRRRCHRVGAGEEES